MMAVSKCPCLTLSRVNVMLDAKISLVPKHQLNVPSTLLNEDDLKGKVYI